MKKRTSGDQVAEIEVEAGETLPDQLQNGLGVRLDAGVLRQVATGRAANEGEPSLVESIGLRVERAGRRRRHSDLASPGSDAGELAVRLSRELGDADTRPHAERRAGRCHNRVPNGIHVGPNAIVVGEIDGRADNWSEDGKHAVSL